MRGSGFLQLGKLLHQLFHTVAADLNGDLGFVAIAFSANHRALTILRVNHAGTGLEALLPRRLRQIDFWPRELLSARCEELGDIVDGVVAGSRVRGFLLPRV